MQDFPYYTNKEARRVLGDIHPYKLKQYVESGKLNRYIPPGQKHGLYLKTEVHALAEELALFWRGEGKMERKETTENGRIYRFVNSS